VAEVILLELEDVFAVPAGVGVEFAKPVEVFLAPAAIDGATLRAGAHATPDVLASPWRKFSSLGTLIRIPRPKCTAGGKLPARISRYRVSALSPHRRAASGTLMRSGGSESLSG
jgi:hypothetical protein